MKVLLFGATGMVGQGVLRECLLDPGVEAVTAVVRSPLPVKHSKLTTITHADLADVTAIEASLRGHDACCFCLGVSSVGMTEADYRRLTYDLTLAIARILVRNDPGMSFAYVSGAGTDSSERGRLMWARVKGKTENDLAKLPFSRVFAFRPGVIQPLHQVASKTRLYQLTYTIIGPVLSIVKRLWPNSLVTSVELGRAMIVAARSVPQSAVFEVRDIVRLASSA